MFYFIGAVALLLLANIILSVIACTTQLKAGVVGSYSYHVDHFISHTLVSLVLHVNTEIQKVLFSAVRIVFFISNRIE